MAGISLFASRCPCSLEDALLLLLFTKDGVGIGFPWWLSSKESARQEMPETLVQSLDQEHPLEEGMATHSSILA